MLEALICFYLIIAPVTVVEHLLEMTVFVVEWRWGNGIEFHMEN